MTGDLTKSELVGILEIIEAAQACADKTRARELLLKARDLVEAEWAVSGIITAQPSLPPEIVCVLNGNYPEDMFGHYLSGRLYVKDPVVRYHANFSMTRLWSEILKEVDDDAARQVVNYASDFGLRYGVSSGLYLPDTESVAITSFAGPKDKFKGRHKYVADILAAHLNRALVRCSPIVQGAAKEKGQEQQLAVF